MFVLVYYLWTWGVEDPQSHKRTHTQPPLPKKKTTYVHSHSPYNVHTHTHSPQTSILLQDLVNRKADLEHQLQEKVEENYRQVTDLREEKRVLLHIIEQLCLEAGKPIDIV